MPDLILPVGISFYTFQTIGYLIDVWKGKTEAEKSFLRFALFVSFFPQLVAGPIERSSSLLAQLREPAEFDYDRVKDGLLLMLWGYFEKMWIADRAAILVDQGLSGLPELFLRHACVCHGAVCGTDLL